MTWDEVLVYMLGCLALEQSRDITSGKQTRKLQKLGIACMQQGGWACWDKVYGRGPSC